MAKSAAPSEKPKTSALEVPLGPIVRRLRERNGWSIKRLAEEAGISPAAVFKIEKDRMVPSVTVLLKLSRALKQSLVELLEGATDIERPPYAVFRADERPEMQFADFPVSLQRIVGLLPDKKLEAGIYRVDRDGAPSADPITHPGEKLYFVLAGAFRFDVDDRHVDLQAGDALHLKGEVPHRWRNIHDGQSQLLFVLTPPPFGGAEA